MEKHVTLRTAAPQDLREIAGLERSCSTAAHWSERQYQDLLDNAGQAARLVLIAESSPDDAGRFDPAAPILGFLIAHHLAPEWELENIVVAPEARGQGVGTRLMGGLLARASQTNSQAVFLEVRESNVAAISLYEKLGFQQTGRRKSYYSNPVEDALLYCK